ncbi:MAG: ketoacyl-ACP synthase III [Bacillota bacterium]|jgi:3-oxoacyl-(acyl-carrier-protein) synthase III
MAKNAVINGVGAYLPKNALTSEAVEDLAGFKKFGIRNGMVKLFTGVETRRYADRDEQPSDIAFQAGAAALKTAEICPADIDVIIFCAITNDFLEPAIAHLVQQRIGAKNAQCFDVKNACNAFMNGLDIADSMIKAAKAECVLVVSGEVPSRLLKFNCESKEEVLRRNTSYSAGDGGGAFVLCAAATAKRGIVKTAFKSFGELWKNNVNWGGGVMYPHEPEKFYFVGDTKELVAKSFEVAPAFFKETIAQAGWETAEVDFFIGAQVAKYITSEMTKRIGIPWEKTITVLPQYGNTGAAGIPIAASEALAQGRIKAGDKVVLFGAGNGLSLGCLCVKW